MNKSNRKIVMLVPRDKQGGVYAFSSQIQDKLGVDQARIIIYSKETAGSISFSGDEIVILQMSHYGFDKNGIPFWLLRILKKKRNQMLSFGVFFHELFATGPPWSSSFWISPAQRYISGRLVALCDFWMTNRQESAQWLKRFSVSKPFKALPIPSSAGEQKNEAVVNRSSKVVVFGSPGLREVTYLAFGDRLFSWVEKYSLVIHDIGSPVKNEELVGQLNKNCVVQHGYLQNNEIHILMKDALFGLLEYPVEYVAKSSVFAAYCAHGICPILITEPDICSDGLSENVHYLVNLPNDMRMEEALDIGQAALVWYRKHDIAAHVRLLEEIMDESGV